MTQDQDTPAIGQEPPQPCQAALRPSGEPCGSTMPPVRLDPRYGQWRCLKHYRGGASPTAGAGDPPVTEIKTPQDALALTSWAAIALSRGRISPQASTQIASTCREWRQTYELVHRLKELEARLEVFERAYNAERKRRSLNPTKYVQMPALETLGDDPKDEPIVAITPTGD